jgi:hypothetical protein
MIRAHLGDLAEARELLRSDFLHTVSDYSAVKGMKTINETAEWSSELKRYFT